MEAFQTYLITCIEFGLVYDVPVTLSFGLAIFVPFWAIYGLTHAFVAAFEEMWNA